MAIRKSAIRLVGNRIALPASLPGAMTCTILGEKYIQKMNKDIYKAVEILLKNAKSETTYTVQTWLEEWLKSYKSMRVKSGTYRDYVKILSNHVYPAIGGILLGDLEGLELQHFINSVERDNTRKKIAVILSAALKKAVLLHLIPFNPFESVELPRSYVNHYRALEFDIQEKVLDACIAKYRPVFFFLCCTGLRIGEFLAIDWQKDVDHKGRFIYVTKTVDIDTGEVLLSPKTDNSVRSVPFLEDLLPVIKVLSQNRYTYTSCRLYFSRLYKRLRLRGYNIHSFRHTFASVCNAVGMRPKTAQHLLGHSDVNLTLNLYTHVLRAGKSKIFEYVQKLKIELEGE